VCLSVCMFWSIGPDSQLEDSARQVVKPSSKAEMPADLVASVHLAVRPRPVAPDAVQPGGCQCVIS
jgi:hypothetical protein